MRQPPAETIVTIPSARSPAASPVAIGVTVFRPTPEQVATLRARVAAEARLTIVFDNGVS